jgi:hypothetical protein
MSNISKDQNNSLHRTYGNSNRKTAPLKVTRVQHAEIQMLYDSSSVAVYRADQATPSGSVPMGIVPRIFREATSRKVNSFAFALVM